jgi:hypothetical protein
MFTDQIIERRNAVLKDWPAFLSAPLPRLIAEVVERSKNELPADFVQWAPTIALASDHLLRLAQYRHGWRRPSGRSSGQPHVFTKVVNRNRLMVRGCGEFWTVEREIDEVLAFTFGLMPIFTRTPEAAMCLAEYCHPLGAGSFCPHPDHVPGVTWVIWTPDGIRWC